MPHKYLIAFFVITCIATLFSIRTTFLAWFQPEQLRREIDRRSKTLTDSYPATSFWKNVSTNKIRLSVSLGFIFVVLMDIVLFQSLFR
jgi:hypothetical protein